MSIDISTTSPTQLVLKYASKNQADLQEVSMEIASGNKNSDFVGFAKDATTENFLAFKSTLTAISAHTTSNNTAISRSQTMDSSISQIQGWANDLAALITQRNNGASTNLPVAVEVNGILDKITGALNVQFDGRYLFAGSTTNTVPVSDLKVSNLDNTTTPPTATTNYYNGDNNIVSVRSSDSEEVQYGILASDPGFKDLIAAAHMAIDGDAANDSTKLGQAMDMVNKSIDELTSTRATGKIAVDRLQKANASLQSSQLLIQGNLDKISQTDIVKATSTMSELQAIVQAGYLAFSRLSNLRLTDYLR